MRREEPIALDAPASLPASREARADRLWELLCAAVSAAPAGPLRVTLSGGLDSRAVAAAAAHTRGEVIACTFGEADCADLPIARDVARALGLSHEVLVLPPDAALRHEDRVFEATGGLGGIDVAPGAHSDAPWATGCVGLLSGSSGDVAWGDTRLSGRTPPLRRWKLGLVTPSSGPGSIPAAPVWASPAGRRAWINLLSRQARVTWNGLASRRAHTPVFAVPWDPSVLSFCLALGAEDRADRSLLRLMLARHAPAVASLPAVRARTYDLDRAMRTDPAWARELEQMALDVAAWRTLGLRPRGVARLLRLQARGDRRRAGLVARLRLLRRWARRPQPQGGWL